MNKLNMGKKGRGNYKQIKNKHLRETMISNIQAVLVKKKVVKTVPLPILRFS